MDVGDLKIQLGAGRCLLHIIIDQWLSLMSTQEALGDTSILHGHLGM